MLFAIKQNINIENNNSSLEKILNSAPVKNINTLKCSQSEIKMKIKGGFVVERKWVT